MEVEPDKYVVCLGDLNGRLKVLEPHIETDINGKIIEDWTERLRMHHLNQSTKFTWTYTYGEEGGRRSEVDHIIVNGRLMKKIKGMFIDEDKIDLDISDHNLIRAWFNMGVSEEIKWKKPRYEIIEWY